MSKLLSFYIFLAVCFYLLANCSFIFAADNEDNIDKVNKISSQADISYKDWISEWTEYPAESLGIYISSLNSDSEIYSGNIPLKIIVCDKPALYFDIICDQNSIGTQSDGINSFFIPIGTSGDSIAKVYDLRSNTYIIPSSYFSDVPRRVQLEAVFNGLRLQNNVEQPQKTKPLSDIFTFLGILASVTLVLFLYKRVVSSRINSPSDFTYKNISLYLKSNSANFKYYYAKVVSIAKVILLIYIILLGPFVLAYLTSSQVIYIEQHMAYLTQFLNVSLLRGYFLDRQYFYILLFYAEYIAIICFIICVIPLLNLAVRIYKNDFNKINSKPKFFSWLLFFLLSTLIVTLYFPQLYLAKIIALTLAFVLLLLVSRQNSIRKFNINKKYGIWMLVALVLQLIILGVFTSNNKYKLEDEGNHKLSIINKDNNIVLPKRISLKNLQNGFSTLPIRTGFDVLADNYLIFHPGFRNIYHQNLEKFTEKPNTYLIFNSINDIPYYIYKIPNLKKYLFQDIPTAGMIVNDNDGVTMVIDCSGSEIMPFKYDLVITGLNDQYFIPETLQLSNGLNSKTEMYFPGCGAGQVISENINKDLLPEAPYMIYIKADNNTPYFKVYSKFADINAVGSNNYLRDEAVLAKDDYIVIKNITDTSDTDLFVFNASEENETKFSYDLDRYTDISSSLNKFYKEKIKIEQEDFLLWSTYGIVNINQ
jgi:hypothetical protein